MKNIETCLSGKEDMAVEEMLKSYKKELIDIENIVNDNDKTLMEIAEEEGAFEGILDDDYEEAFNRWLESRETSELVEMLINYKK